MGNLSVNKNSSMEIAKLENTSAKTEAQKNGRTFVVGTKCSSMKQFGFILAAIFSLGLATISKTCRLGAKGIEELKIKGLGSDEFGNKYIVSSMGSDTIKKIGTALLYQGLKEKHNIAPEGLKLTRDDVKKMIDEDFKEGRQGKVVNFITAAIQKAIEEKDDFVFPFAEVKGELPINQKEPAPQYNPGYLNHLMLNKNKFE